MSRRPLILVGLLMELCYLIFYVFPDGPGEVLVLIAVNVAAYLLLSYILWRMRRSPAHPEHARFAVLSILAFGVLFRFSLVPHEVVGSDDIYRYLWDGKVSASGVNPFAHFPLDPQLSSLASADLPGKVNHPEMRSVYPALAQGLFWLSNRLFGDSVQGMKFLLVCFDVLTLAVLLVFYQKRKISARTILIYAWSPLPILYFGLDGHIDALGIPFLILGLLFLSSNRPVRGALALGVGSVAKLFPLLIVPLLLQLNKGWRRFALAAIPPVMVLIGSLLFYEPTGGVIDSLKTFGAHWVFNGSVFSILYFMGLTNETAHLLCGIMILSWMGILTMVNRPLLEKVFWGFVGFILLSPVVHPWYLTWLAALLAIRWSTAVFVFLGLSATANIVVYQYRAYGAWVDQPILLLIEYIPVALLLVREIVRHEVLQSGEFHPASLPPSTSLQDSP